jgi:hypothetical protein
MWLPLRWSEAPPGTDELILVNSVIHFENRIGAPRAHVFSADVLAALSPERRRIEVKETPKGSYWKTHYGRFCPPRNEKSGMVFSIYAMPQVDYRLRQVNELELADLEALDRSALASGSLAVFYGQRKGPVAGD